MCEGKPEGDFPTQPLCLLTPVTPNKKTIKESMLCSIVSTSTSTQWILQPPQASSVFFSPLPYDQAITSSPFPIAACIVFKPSKAGL